MRPSAKVLIEEMVDKPIAIAFTRHKRLPPEGYFLTAPNRDAIFDRIVDVLADISEYGSIMLANKFAAANALLKNGMVVVISDHELISFYSEGKMLLTDVQIASLEKYFKITPETPVTWFHNLSSFGQDSNAQELIYGGMHRELPFGIDDDDEQDEKVLKVKKPAKTQWAWSGGLSSEEEKQIELKGGHPSDLAT